MSRQPEVKIIAMMKRKPGLTMKAFMEYYENNHAPLCLKILPGYMDYRRSYVVSDAATAATTIGSRVDYDVITEVWFATKADFAQFNSACENQEIRDTLKRDELNFIDRESVQMFVVEEHKSSISKV